jgi:hypothetical protein
VSRHETQTSPRLGQEDPVNDHRNLLPGVNDLDLNPAVEVVHQHLDGGAGMHHGVGHQLIGQSHHDIEGCWSDDLT